MSFKLFFEAQQHNIAPIDDLREFADRHGELFRETDHHLVVKPRTHKTACYYGQYTRSRFCVADKDNPNDWNMLDMIAQMTGGDPAAFYYAFNKQLSLKNKNAIFGIVSYPITWSQMMISMSDEQIIAQGKQRFAQEVGTELAYDDQFLLQWVAQIRDIGHLFESYNSNNRVILPYDLRDQIGHQLFADIILR